MAIPTGPATRPKRRVIEEPNNDGNPGQTAAAAGDRASAERASAERANADRASAERATLDRQPVSHAMAAAAASAAATSHAPAHSATLGHGATVALGGNALYGGILGHGSSLAPERLRSRESVRQSGRIPSEAFHRDALLSPAVLALTLLEYFELAYGDEQRVGEVTLQDLFRMRDQAAWPDLFGSGDPRTLFTEDMCRRGQFAPVAWGADGLSFATCKDDGAQDELMRALDLLVGLPVTLYSVSPEAVDAGVTWLYRRSG